VAPKKKRKKRAHKQRFAEQVAIEQQRTAVALESLTVAVRAVAPASSDQVLEEIRKLLDDVLVAQHRTNQLLELALRAGFDDDERARTS
jgi:hypothetical protein